jgi:Biotin-requiring enzyme
MAREIKLPDIGDFKDVPIIEIAVKPGDIVKLDDPLITLESDKASMEVPSPSAGSVREIFGENRRPRRQGLSVRAAGKRRGAIGGAGRTCRDAAAGNDGAGTESGAATCSVKIRRAGIARLFRRACQPGRSSHGT